MSQLRIWIDALVLDHQAAGIGQYIRRLFEAYATQFAQDELVGLFQPGVSISGVQSDHVAKNLSSAQRIFYEQWVIPARLRRTSADVVHFPDYQVPFVCPQAHTVMTVHDLAAFVLPEVFPGAKSGTKRFLMRRSVQRADRIIVPSMATRDDLIEILHVPAEKIRVVPHGVKRSGVPLQTRVQERPYFLAVGTVEPRKNFTRVIQAYHLLAEQRQDLPDLVIAGRLGWMYDETLELPEKLGLAPKVKFLQYVSEDILATLYRDAVCLVYPSLYEGFGLPVVEAMQANIPVVTSSQGSLLELGGDSLWRANPYDAAAIAEQMGRVLDGGENVRERVRKAREWANQLTWDNAAALTREVYEEIMKES